MQQSIKSCVHCLQPEGNLPKAPLQVDFTSIEMIPNQTAKTVTKFLYQGYISIIGAPARLLSDQGANFISSIIDNLCTLLNMKKLQTMLYHPQTNGLVDRSHQTIMQMIRKLGDDKKAEWPGCLAEIVQVYNATDPL